MTIYLEYLFALYYSFVASYTLLLTVSGKLNSPLKTVKTSDFQRIAMLIPAYKEDDVIIDVAKSYGAIDYPDSHFDVYIIADSMKKGTIQELKKYVNVIEVSFEKSTKVKSLNAAFDRISSNYDVAVINDADNVVEQNFLNRINYLFSLGFKAVQGQRMAKNTNTEFAILDALSEVINNHIYRKGQNGLGLSSVLIGSGMAFEFRLLKDLMAKNKAIGGFDKVLQLALLEKGIFIKYDEAAIVFDEKTESSSTFRDQRKRWISSQVKYFIKNIPNSFKQLYKGNFNYFNIAFLTTLMQPRILVVAGLVFICALATVFQEFLHLDIKLWWILLVVYIISMFLSIPRHYYIKPLFLAFLKIPSAMFHLLFAFANLKNSDKQFIHTKHQSVGVNNVFYNKWKGTSGA